MEVDCTNSRSVVLIVVGVLVVSFGLAAAYASMAAQYGQDYQRYGGQAMGYGLGNGMGMMNGAGSMMQGMGSMMGGYSAAQQSGYDEMYEACIGMMNQWMSGSQHMASYTATTNQVRIVNYAYSPKVMQVARGTTVTWINLDSVAHSVTSGTPSQPAQLFDSGLIQQNQSFSYTFSTPGTYTYFCKLHPFMTGTIVVT